MLKVLNDKRVCNNDIIYNRIFKIYMLLLLLNIQFIVMFIELSNYEDYKSNIAHLWTDTDNRKGIRCRSGSHPFIPDNNPQGNF